MIKGEYSTITGCTIDDDLEITGDNNTISNNTLKATVTIAGNNASISGNTFTMTGADTAITSPGTNNAFTGLEIINNTFSGDGSYIGIDLKDDFGNPAANPAETDTQAITLTNNDMTGVLDTGIKIASGVATIKNSDISSDGTGVGILLTDGGDHVLGVDGDLSLIHISSPRDLSTSRMPSSA